MKVSVIKSRCILQYVSLPDKTQENKSDVRVKLYLTCNLWAHLEVQIKLVGHHVERIISVGFSLEHDSLFICTQTLTLVTLCDIRIDDLQRGSFVLCCRIFGNFKDCAQNLGRFVVAVGYREFDQFLNTKKNQPI